MISPFPAPGELSEEKEEGKGDGDGCLFGWVYFRQARDEGTRRGFFQVRLS
jgi:hypothetical protein